MVEWQEDLFNMSTRAMAQHFSSGGGRYPMQSLDLLGLRERKANRMADADLARQVQLLELIEKLDRETGGLTSKRKIEEDTAIKRNETISKAGFTPEQWQILEPLLTEKQKNELNATLSAQKVDKSNANGLDPKFLSTSSAGYLATLAKPAIEMQKESQIRTQPGEDVSFRPWTDLSTMAFGKGARNQSTSMEFMPSIGPDGKIITVPKSSEIRSQSSGDWDIPVDMNKRVSAGVTNSAPLNPIPYDPTGGQPLIQRDTVNPATRLSSFIVPDSSLGFSNNSSTGFQKPVLNPAPDNAPPSTTAFGTPAMNNPDFYLQKLQLLDKLMRLIPSNANPDK